MANSTSVRVVQITKQYTDNPLLDTEYDRLCGANA